MSKKYKRLDDWKAELIGKRFTFLTVNDVIQITDDRGKKIYTAVCECKCGNSCNVSVYALIREHNKSCGCYETSDENSERHRKINEKNRDIMSENRRKWCQEHSDVMKEIGIKRSKYYKDNPEKAEEISNRCKQWAKDNPDKVKEIAEKNRQWRNDNPGKVAEMIVKQQQWRNDKEKVEAAKTKRRKTLAEHPEICKLFSETTRDWRKNDHDKVKEAAAKRKLYYKNHPEKLSELSDKLSQWAKDDHDRLSEIGDPVTARCRAKRMCVDYSKLIEIIHSDYIDELMVGGLSSDSIIKTKCPICGEYDTHSLGTVFIFSRAELRTGSAPLCTNCITNHSVSQYENEIADYIYTFYNGQLSRNDRSIISPFELDLYYQEKKIAIEFNGDYWHSDEFKGKDYHYNKFFQCKEKGILLISIFESEWNNRKDEIKEYLKDVFNNVTNKLSYLKDGYVSNNYPDVNSYNTLSNNILEHYYAFGSNKVYTCGYTKLE